MPDTVKTLIMTFAVGTDKKATLSISNPKAGLNEASVRSAMDTILASGVFTTKDGSYNDVLGADMVERQVNKIF